ncbi:MAG TPA: hypothetical protein EYH01_03155, partial [Campylobacterales bacterium]|nr:hypothetical protein [Campylobacterales bacterium]
MINKGLMVLGGALLFTGCGGSGTTAIETGVGYYEDSAVSGVSYVCGSKEGLTGENGSFTFEKGKGCVFTVNGIELREVLANGLTEGVKI